MAQLKPFKGKARELTVLIFQALDAESPLNPYKIWKRVDLLCKKRGLTAPYLHMVTRRVRYLADRDYLKVVYRERKESGQEVKFYELSGKVRLAKWLHDTDLERFVESITETEATSILNALQKKRGSAPNAHN